MTDDPDAPHRAELVFDQPDPERARLLAGSVGQEVGEIEGDRTRATVAARDRSVVVRVAAEDLVALRAGVNTWSTLVEVAERVASVGEPPAAADADRDPDPDRV
ncbi:MAG: KEOPS complex subunit Pcc1 [Haloarculaceae archaeon]